MQPTPSRESRPWYVKRKGEVQTPLIQKNSMGQRIPPEAPISSFRNWIRMGKRFFPAFLALSFFGAALFLLDKGMSFKNSNLWIPIILLSLLFFLFAILALLDQIGRVCSEFTQKHNYESKIRIGFRYLKKNVEKEDARRGIPAPEMALYQFVQQVRAYALEKSFLKQKTDRNMDLFSNIVGGDASGIIKRRWNDVMDSLNEFEIYLANDPQGIIEKLVAKFPNQNIDVSQVFRDVAETFDTAWRRKGINIEHAIVTPLKANINEPLLRRLLVGPWRSCVYFARRGNGVIFSSKSFEGKIIAHWECEGVAFPEEFFSLVSNEGLSVNERIEQCMGLICENTNSPNTLFALISFVTWLDLVRAARVHYSFSQGNTGLVIELQLQ